MAYHSGPVLLGRGSGASSKEQGAMHDSSQPPSALPDKMTGRGLSCAGDASVIAELKCYRGVRLAAYRPPAVADPATWAEVEIELSSSAVRQMPADTTWT